MSAAFLSETTDDRKKWHNTFNKVLKENHRQLRILYLAKIPFKNKDTDTLRGKKTKENSQPADGSNRITKESSSDRRKKKYQKETQNIKSNSNYRSLGINIYQTIFLWSLKYIWQMKAKYATFSNRIFKVYIKRCNVDSYSIKEEGKEV